MKTFRRKFGAWPAAALMAALGLGSIAGPAEAGKTMDAIKARGAVNCGVSTGVGGFAIADSQGRWTGLNVDFCRALAAAVLGDPNKVKFTPLTPQQRFTALQSGEIDILSTIATWTLTRDASLGLMFAGVYFYDGQTFLVPKSLNVKSARELDGASICTATGTTTELNMADFARANKIRFRTVVFESQSEARAAFFAGRCQAFSADTAYLSSIRASDTAKPDDWVILPELISKEPLGPAVGRDDIEWFEVVRWVLFALVEAEELGVTKDNAEAMRKNTDPSVQRLLGSAGGLGQKLKLSDDWAYAAIKAVGNYGEIFERNVGASSPLKLDRGLNALWKKGGLMYAMPAR